MDGRFIAMEVGQLEENVRNKLKNAPVTEHFYIYILLLSTSVLHLSFLLSLWLQYPRSLHLF